METNSIVIPNVRLKQMREMRGWSQKFVAEQIDAPAACYVSRWERGITRPSPFYREKLCRFFNLNADELGFLSQKIDEEIGDMSDNHVSQDTRDPLSFIKYPLHLSEMVPLLGHPVNLVGRSTLLQRLKQQVCSNEGEAMTALYGLAGVGKTSLAIELILDSDVLHYFCDGIIWIDVGLHPQIPALLSTYAGQLGFSVKELESLADNREALSNPIRSVIGTRRMLVILDDVWKSEDITAVLEAGGVNCSCLITTRLPCVALGLMNTNAIAVTELDEEDRYALLTRFIPPVKSEEAAAIHSLLHLVGGLPLALTMIGKYLQVQAYGGLTRRLRTALDDLYLTEKRLQLTIHPLFLGRGSSRSTLVTLHDSIALSIEHLTAPLQQAFCALTLLPAMPHSFSEEAALAVSAIEIDKLDILIDTGLLEGDGPGRYSLHRIFSDIVRVKRGNQEAKARLAAYTIRHVEQYGTNIAYLETEYATILAGLETMFELHLDKELYYCICTLAPFFQDHDFYDLSEKYLLRRLYYENGGYV